jgi:hypothetical protein
VALEDQFKRSGMVGRAETMSMEQSLQGDIAKLNEEANAK